LLNSFQLFDINYGQPIDIPTLYNNFTYDSKVVLSSGSFGGGPMSTPEQVGIFFGLEQPNEKCNQK
jgi:hypothetical protein